MFYFGVAAVPGHIALMDSRWVSWRHMGPDIEDVDFTVEIKLFLMFAKDECDKQFYFLNSDSIMISTLQVCSCRRV